MTVHSPLVPGDLAVLAAGWDEALEDPEVRAVAGAIELWAAGTKPPAPEGVGLPRVVPGGAAEAADVISTTGA